MEDIEGAAMADLELIKAPISRARATERRYPGERILNRGAAHKDATKQKSSNDDVLKGKKIRVQRQNKSSTFPLAPTSEVLEYSEGSQIEFAASLPPNFEAPLV